MPWKKRPEISIPWVCDGRRTARRDEDHQAGEEDPAFADQVAEPPDQQQQAAERDQVGVDDPGQAALAEPEAVWIEGRATFTIVTSRTIIRTPVQRT